jgi:hypothetical protein
MTTFFKVGVYTSGKDVRTALESSNSGKDSINKQKTFSISTTRKINELLKKYKKAMRIKILKYNSINNCKTNKKSCMACFVRM